MTLSTLPTNSEAFSGQPDLQELGVPIAQHQYPQYPQKGGFPPATPYPAYPNLGAITNQPTVFSGAPMGNTPYGLEYLTMIDQLLIKQQVEMLEAFTGWESSNKYKVLNSLGQEIFFAKEDTDCCNRQCCGPSRPFSMNIVDAGMREVLHLERPLRCQACCFPCCLQELEVYFH